MSQGLTQAPGDPGEGGEEADPYRPGQDRSVGLLSVSIDLGAGRRGVDMGPSALRLADLVPRIEALGYTVVEAGAVHAAGPEVSDAGESRARFLPEIQSVCDQTRNRVLEILDAGHFPLVLGGDHSLTMGSASAVAEFHRRRGESVGLIWVDAHTDMNTPEITPSGNIHGMSLAVLTGLAPELSGLDGLGPPFDPAHVSVLGAREIDPAEREGVRGAGIRVFTMSEVDERGASVCVQEAIERASRGTAGMYVSFDLDVIDPMTAPGVGTPVTGGLSYREAHLICEKLAASGSLLGFELVELNPVLDLGNRTAQVGVGLLESALGKRIL
jgi:arginase